MTTMGTITIKKVVLLCCTTLYVGLRDVVARVPLNFMVLLFLRIYGLRHGDRFRSAVFRARQVLSNGWDVLLSGLVPRCFFSSFFVFLFALTFLLIVDSPPFVFDFSIISPFLSHLFLIVSRCMFCCMDAVRTA